MVAALAQALGVTTDELFGLKPTRAPRPAGAGDPRAQRVHKKVQQLLRLPEKDQRAVIRLVNSLVAAKAAGRDE
jgi:hypothetical protein